MSIESWPLTTRPSPLNTLVKIIVLSREKVEKLFSLSRVFTKFLFLEQVWIYTRDKKPGKSVLKRAYKSLKILGLNGWKLKKADQSCSGSKETNTIGSIRRNYEVASSGPRARARGPSGHKKHDGGWDGRTAALDYDYDNNYRSQLRHRTPITTRELSQRMLGTGLKIGQSLIMP